MQFDWVVVEGGFGGAVQGAEAGRALDEIWSGKPDLFTRLNTAPSAGAPGDPAGTERAYFSAKTVQIITDCFFNAPLWYLWGRGLFHQFLQPQQLVWWDFAAESLVTAEKSNMITWWVAF